MIREPVLYPRLYPWFILLATADVLLTWLILAHYDGVELNPIAARVIGWQGMMGATMLKFAGVMFVMWTCEFIGRQRQGVGRNLLVSAVLLNCVPVTASVAQLATVTG